MEDLKEFELDLFYEIGKMEELEVLHGFELEDLKEFCELGKMEELKEFDDLEALVWFGLVLIKP